MVDNFRLYADTTGLQEEGQKLTFLLGDLTSWQQDFFDPRKPEQMLAQFVAFDVPIIVITDRRFGGAGQRGLMPPDLRRIERTPSGGGEPGPGFLSCAHVRQTYQRRVSGDIGPIAQHGIDNRSGDGGAVVNSAGSKRSTPTIIFGGPSLALSLL